MQSFAQDLYGQPGADAATGADMNSADGATEPKQADAETVDADFEVVDEENKDKS